MSGHTPWRKIRDANLTSAQVRELEAEVDVLSATIALGELRKSRKITQKELARRLGTRQPNISRLERRPDLRIRALREAIEAMGGELRLTAHFPDGEYPLDSLSRAPEATPAE
jgi:transcriptional regulator